ncbi:hypothetical protein BB170200_00012 [Mycobacterium marinum]|nr:hypothetical protein BB170200_00012 [Mycobacterium marinum]
MNSVINWALSFIPSLGWINSWINYGINWVNSLINWAFGFIPPIPVP